jgi:hypothetical protein
MKTVILLLAACLAGPVAFAADDCDRGECDPRDNQVHRWLNPHTGKFEVYRGDKRVLYNSRTDEWSLVDTGKRPVHVPNNDRNENPR